MEDASIVYPFYDFSTLPVLWFFKQPKEKGQILLIDLFGSHFS